MKIQKKLITSPDSKIMKVFKNIKDSGFRTLVVTSKKGHLLGTISDGDIRKFLIKGGSINRSISKIFNTSPKYFVQGNYDISKLKKYFIKFQFGIIPITNKQKKLIKIFTWQDIFKQRPDIKVKKIPIDVVIMAGGEGRRLKPYTNVLPKPLMPINEKPLIDYIINTFTERGFKNFLVSINFKSNIIKSYFKDLTKNYRINFIEEKTPLGTIGAISLIKNKVSQNFIITNCDTIYNIDYSKFYNFHLKKGNLLTIAVSGKKIIFPYGVCEIDKKDNLINMEEKPKKNFLVNTGLYLMNKKLIKYFPKNKLLDINNIIEICKEKKIPISTFLINEKSWSDFGSLKNYLNKFSSFDWKNNS